MSRKIVAGIDSSTQSCKVHLFDLDSGAYVGGASSPHAPAFPPTSEQNPSDWWSALVSAFTRAVRGANVSPADIAGISIAAQCHGLVALDARDRVIRPAKLWNDTTAAADLTLLRVAIGDSELVQKTGTLPTAAFTIGKLAWMARVEPRNFAAIAHILLPHDYLTYRLTGQRVTDRSEASGTGYFDANSNQYLPHFLAHIDPERDWLPLLPEVLGPDTIAGEVQVAAQNELGLPPGILVGAGGGDQHAAALGLGISAGDVVYSFGTSGVVSALSAVPIRDQQGFVDGVADMTHGYMPLVSTLNATKTTDTFASILGVNHEGLSDLALNADPLLSPTLAPFLDGERTPDLPGAVGILAGITTATTREQIALAAYEGVVLGLVTGQRHLERMGVPTHGRILAVGGGAKSPAYLQILADASGRDVHVTDVDEATARGAAVQAAAIARGRTVTEVRAQWAPASRVAATPRAFSEDRWTAYHAVTAIRSLDRT